MRSFRALSILLLTGLLLVGCGNPGLSSADAAKESASRLLMPEDQALATVYKRSCRNCHTIAATGAPLTGDHAGWAPLMEKGLDVLVDNVVSGIGGMPPFGLCMACDAEQFEALITFMASADGAGE
ncbi:MAG: c-type cytochrome [Halioglobus sp.]